MPSVNIRTDSNSLDSKLFPDKLYTSFLSRAMFPRVWKRIEPFVLKRLVHISVSLNPNEHIRHFIPEGISKGTTRHPQIISPLRFSRNHHEDIESAMAKSLLQLPGVHEVILSPDYSVTIEKRRECSWTDIQSRIILILNRMFSSNAPLISLQERKVSKSSDVRSHLTNDTFHQSNKQFPKTSFEASIQDVLQEHVVPVLSQEGGTVIFEKYDPLTKTVYLSLQGFCSGCEQKTTTIKDHIQSLLMYFFEEEVVSIEILGM